MGIGRERFCGRFRGTESLLLKLCLALAGANLAGPAAANSDPLTGVLAPGSAGIGGALRAESSPYRGAKTQYDYLPLFVYEGEHLYLHSYGLGLKLGSGAATQPRFDVFIRRRFEGTPYHGTPQSLSGMAKREVGADAGASVELGGDWGIGFAELLRDASGASRGAELRLGYKYPLQRGRLQLRPYFILGARNGTLNNYYYGVRPEEATASRAAYSAGAGVAPELGFHGAYGLSQRWSLVLGYSLTRLPSSIADSPIVGSKTQWQATMGLAYNLTPERKDWVESAPLIVRGYYGASSDCNVGHVIQLQCASIHTKDKTGLAGFELGRPLIERLNGWPLDIAGFVGAQRHFEDGLQPDFWSFRAYFKPYFYGFPWDSYVRTRLGLGIGFSWAERIPFSEQRDLSSKGSNTSKLLNTFDPTVDFSVGDVIGKKNLHDTYVGLGVSHRSGIFGWTRLYGNVNGGSNYIYVYVETKL
jgi:MipA family protein